MSQAQKHIDNVGKWFDKALGFAKVAEDRKRKEEERVAAEAAEKGAEKQPEVRKNFLFSLNPFALILNP